LVAADPAAFGALFNLLLGAAKPDYRLDGPLAIIETVGPFDHHEGLFASYDGFKRRFTAAMAAVECRGVLVSGDSPGGVVDGMLDTAREIRAIAERAGKPFWWYVDAKSVSSAFAQACAADRIFVPETGQVGSIGVYTGLRDCTARDAAAGERWVIVTSGALKAVGNEHLPISDEAVAETQRIIDGANSAFYAWVSERRGVTPEKLAELAGRVMMGAEAVALGLADEVRTFDEVRALMLASLETGTALAGGGQQMDEKEKAIAALKALADKGDEKAARALKAMTDEEPAKEEEPKKEEAKAEGTPPPAKEHTEPDGDEEKAKASSFQKFEARLANVETNFDNEKRTALFAARPDLAPEFKSSLSALSPAQVKTILDATPVAQKPVPSAVAARAALAAGAPTQTGNGTNVVASVQSDPRFEKVDRMFGLQKTETPLVELKGTQLFLNPGTPEQAVALLKALDAGQDVLS
jgi:ClpP class serine protease